jgi:hypothetical protein
MIRFALCVALLLTWIASFSDCSAGEISCPSMLDATTQTIGAVPNGWSAQQTTLKHALNGIRVNFGPLQSAADGAIYDRRTMKKGESGEEIETLSWELHGLHDPYLICSYFGTSVVLTRSLAGLSRCEAISVRGNGMARFQMRSTSCS